MITIWDELFFNLRVSFDGILIRKKLLLGSSHCIDTHLDVVVKVIEVQIRVYFELCLDEEFIEFWGADLMVEIPHATIVCRVSIFQWWIPPASREHSGKVHIIR